MRSLTVGPPVLLGSSKSLPLFFFFFLIQNSSIAICDIDLKKILFSLFFSFLGKGVYDVMFYIIFISVFIV